MVSPLNFIAINDCHTSNFIPTKNDVIFTESFNSRYRKKQKRTNTYLICDKKNTKEKERSLKSKNRLKKKYELRKSFNLYRLNEKTDYFY